MSPARAPRSSWPILRGLMRTTACWRRRSPLPRAGTSCRSPCISGSTTGSWRSSSSLSGWRSNARLLSANWHPRAGVDTDYARGERRGLLTGSAAISCATSSRCRRSRGTFGHSIEARDRRTSYARRCLAVLRTWTECDRRASRQTPWCPRLVSHSEPKDHGIAGSRTVSAGSDAAGGVSCVLKMDEGRLGVSMCTWRAGDSRSVMYRRRVRIGVFRTPIWYSLWTALPTII